MKLGNDFIKKKFDDIDERIDFMIEFCHALQLENEDLLLKIKGLEEEIDTKNEPGKQFSEQEAVIHNKMDGLLKKLNYFSNEGPEEYQSNV